MPSSTTTSWPERDGPDDARGGAQRSRERDVLGRVVRGSSRGAAASWAGAEARSWPVASRWRWARLDWAAPSPSAPTARSRTTPRRSTTARAALTSLRGLRACRFMRTSELPESAPLEVRADWIALQATVATGFRDFETAERRLAEAEALSPTARGSRSSTRPCSRSRTGSRTRSPRITRRSRRARCSARDRRLGAPPGAARPLRGRGGAADARRCRARERGSLAAHLAQILIDLERPEEALEALDRYADALAAAGASRASRVAQRRAMPPTRSATSRRRRGARPSEPRTRSTPRSRAGSHRRTRRGSPRAAVGAVHPAAAPHLLAHRARLAHLLLAAAGRPRGARRGDRLRRHAGLPRAAMGSRQRLARARVPADRPRPRRACSVAASRSRSRPSTPPRRTRRRWPAAIRCAGRCSCATRRTAARRDDAGAAARAAGLARAALPRARAGSDEEQSPELPELPDEREYDELNELELCLLRHERARAQAIRDALARTASRSTAAPVHGRAAVRLRRRPAGAACPSTRRSRPASRPSELYALRRVDLLLQLGRREERDRALGPRARSFRADPVFAIRLAEVLAGRRARRARGAAAPRACAGAAPPTPPRSRCWRASSTARGGARRPSSSTGSPPAPTSTTRRASTAT